MTPELRWLSDPTVFAVNRLDAHSDHLCCRTLDEAESGLTSLRQSLDGAWRFAWSANPAARPADFWQPDADLSGFGTIRVPGHIELQGYGQLQYTNTLYPWDGRSCLRPDAALDGRLYAIGVPAILNLALPSLLVTFLNGLLAGLSQSSGGGPGVF